MDNFLQVPRLIPRVRGGWLALSPLGDRIQIGVSAPTESEARDRYRSAAEAWRRTLASEGRDEVSPASETEGACP